MKGIRKLTCGFTAIAAALLLGSLLLGCSNFLWDEPELSGPPSDGTGGYVQVNIASPSRTVLPKAEELYYTLTYSDGIVNETITLGSVASKTVSVPTGTWIFTVLGYRNPVDAQGVSLDVANGSKSGVVVTSGTNTPVNIELSATQNGRGTLRYSLSYVNNPVVTDIRLKLEKIGGSTQTTALATSTDTSNQTLSGTVPLESGYYYLTWYLYYGRTAVKGDLVHIYDDLETPAAFTIAAADFSDPPNLTALETALDDALDARNGVRISADGAGVASGEYWVTTAVMAALDNAIAEAEEILASHGAGMNSNGITTAASALNTAVGVFTSAKAEGTYNPAGDADLGLFVNGSSTAVSGAGITLGSILAYLKTAAVNNNDSYIAVIGAGEDLSPWILGGSGTETNRVFAGKTGVTLTLKGKAVERVIGLSATGWLFRVESGVTLVLDENITLRGLPDNTASLVLVSSSGTLKMRTGSKISGNTSSSYGGGVYVYNGTFTMNGGEISGNTSYSGGGVYVESTGTFTMNDGEISGNTSSSYGGGVYVAGTFTMSGGARVHLNNPVYLANTTRFITIGGVFDGSDPVALVQPASNLGFIGKPAVKKAEGFAGTLPVDRFRFSSGWTADSDGILAVAALPLAASGETAAAYLSRGSVHFYRFTPVLNKNYTVTHTRPSSSSIYTAAAWEDGSGTLTTNTSTSGTSSTSTSFNANKPGVDIVIMVYGSSTSVEGAYTVKYNEQ